MWQRVLHWILELIGKMDEFASMLFLTPNEIWNEDMFVEIPGLDSTALVVQFFNLFGGTRLIDIIGITGLGVILGIAIFKMIDIFA